MILPDLVVPEMDEFEVLAIINKNKWIERIPITISAETTAVYIDVLPMMSMAIGLLIQKTIRRLVSNTIMLYSKEKFLEHVVTNIFHTKFRNLPYDDRTQNDRIGRKSWPQWKEAEGQKLR